LGRIKHHGSPLWTLQRLCFEPDVAADPSDRGENRDPGTATEAIKKLLTRRTRLENAPHPASDPDESTRTTSRTSGRSNRVEIITRAEPRRSWTLAQKREIVAESFGPDLTPTEVARKYAISSGQLYTWRQQLLGVQATLVRRGAPQFAAVELEPDPPLLAASKPLEAAAPSAATRPEGLIELVLPGGVVLRVDAHVDGRALRRILGALDGR
jgi:transposase